MGGTWPRSPRGPQHLMLLQHIVCPPGCASRSVVSDCDPMDCSTPGLPVHHQLPEFTQTHVH